MLPPLRMMNSQGVQKRRIRRAASTLSPAQLARKRAKDRDSQRAARARNKIHIAELEREILLLRDGPVREVEELLYRNQMLENEVRYLRQAYEAITTTCSMDSTRISFESSDLLPRPTQTAMNPTMHHAHQNLVRRESPGTTQYAIPTSNGQMEDRQYYGMESSQSPRSYAPVVFRPLSSNFVVPSSTVPIHQYSKSNELAPLMSSQGPSTSQIGGTAEGLQPEIEFTPRWPVKRDWGRSGETPITEQFTTMSCWTTSTPAKHRYDPLLRDE